MNLQLAWIAAERFGYGARPDELARIAKDPKGWLRAQVDVKAVAPPSLKRLPPSAGTITRVMEAKRLGDKRLMQRTRKSMGQASRREAILRTLSAVESDLPFRERLVHFWSNHFTVSAQRTLISPIVGAFEREAIRPHVSGRFMDMLLASTRHPAMLLYLDNASSVGPNSSVGRRRSRGLNENLAREVLELHTLGVDGGYRQEDVIRLAELLTGWSIARPEDAQAGKFHFRSRAHQPGSKTFLGQRFDQGGAVEGEWALALLARHPATARHIAAKLTRHFISDAPPPHVIRRLERKFLDTDGDLSALAHELIDCTDAWVPTPQKIKSPNDLVISTFRLLGTGALPEDVLARSLEFLGQVPFRAPSPEGWPDVADDWISPGTLMMRLKWAHFVAAHVQADKGLRDVLARRISLPAFSAATRREVSRAESMHEALALFVASPEFQRR